MLWPKLKIKVRKVFNGELTRTDMWWFVPMFVAFTVITGMGVATLGDAL